MTPQKQPEADDDGRLWVEGANGIEYELMPMHQLLDALDRIDEAIDRRDAEAALSWTAAIRERVQTDYALCERALAPGQLNQ